MLLCQQLPEDLCYDLTSTMKASTSCVFSKAHSYVQGLRHHAAPAGHTEY